MMTAPLADSPLSPESAPVFFAALAASASAAVLTDADGVVRFVNRAAEQIFGYPREELVGQPVELLVGGRYAAGHPSLRTSFMAEPVARRMGTHDGLIGRRRDGSEIGVEVALTPISTSRGTWVLAGIIDVTAVRAAHEETERLQVYYRVLARVNETIVRAPDAETLLARLCAVMVEDGGFYGVGLARATPEGSVVVAHAAGWMRDFLGRVLASLDPEDPRGNSPTVRALRDGEYVASPDLERDPAFAAWAPIIAEHSLRMGVAVPIRMGGKVVAALSMYTNRPLEIDPVLEELLPAIGANVSFALEALDTRDRLAETSRTLSHLLARTVAAQDEERSKIAGDLHDEPVQQLASIDLLLGLLRRRLLAQAPDLAPELEEVQGLVSNVSRDLRDLLFELEPADQEAPLVEIVRRDTERVLTGSDLQWSVEEVDPPAGPRVARWPVDGPARTQVVRIIKEGLRNAIRHSGAANVVVRLEHEERGLMVLVSDDGRGLGDSSSAASGHRGLVTMRERAELMGGTFEATSTGRGTVLRAWIPAPDDGGLLAVERMH